jgi:hypothetical protein
MFSELPITTEMHFLIITGISAALGVVFFIDFHVFRVLISRCVREAYDPDEIEADEPEGYELEGVRMSILDEEMVSDVEMASVWMCN